MNTDVERDLTYAITRRNTVIGIIIIILLSAVRPVFHHRASEALHPEPVSMPQGIDVSHYQGDINWNQVEQSDVAFVYLKATQGTDYVDPLYDTNRQALKEKKTAFGSYHFFQPDLDPTSQAQHFLNTVGKESSLAPVLDIEVTNDVDPKDIRAGAKTWLDAVEQATGCRPIIYTNRYFWNENLGNEFADYALWLADYADEVVLPKDKSQWTLWQKSSSFDEQGIDTSVDEDLFNGSDRQMRSIHCKRL